MAFSISAVSSASESVINITFRALVPCDVSASASEVGTGCCKITRPPDRMCHMCPLPSRQGSFFSPPSKQITPSARTFLESSSNRAPPFRRFLCFTLCWPATNVRVSPQTIADWKLVGFS